jgi:hypothetical protein
MSTEPIVPHVLPVGRDWIISLCEEHRRIEAYDAETLAPLFVGRFIAPKEYRSRDPRHWTKRQMSRLSELYGMYGGTRFDGAIFVLAEVAALRALIASVDEDDAKDLTRMPLIAALAEARDAYSQFMVEQAERLNSNP